MSSNRGARQRLERIFGKICFIEELGIRNIPKEQRKKIKGYTKYDDVLTYHHIREKCKGGKADDENGALVRGYNHRWLHSLPEDQKQKVNNCMIEFKAAFIQHNGKEIIAQDAQSFKINLDFNPQDCIEIPLFPNTPEDEKKKKKYHRAREHQEFRNEVEEAMYLFEHPEERDEDDYTWDWDR